ncbi:hypothetical protein [Devosia sp. SD17-2]|uniref:hypothetical protein n=1 Tax=Devosia sp. SD17-2 TaxID=2976459 RepID=UPI0023D81B54|nr:hypothetical protein [Devosia sp. SD17-2]WEJ32192.1 hypothetical protein NYQ88_14960 [Devosia sp. SD17-2]
MLTEASITSLPTAHIRSLVLAGYFMTKWNQTEERLRYMLCSALGLSFSQGLIVFAETPTAALINTALKVGDIVVEGGQDKDRIARALKRLHALNSVRKKLAHRGFGAGPQGDLVIVTSESGNVEMAAAYTINQILDFCTELDSIATDLSSVSDVLAAQSTAAHERTMKELEALWQGSEDPLF